MTDYSREQLIAALRKADAAGDEVAAKAIARRIQAAPKQRPKTGPKKVGRGILGDFVDSAKFVWGRAAKGVAGLADLPVQAAHTAAGAIEYGKGRLTEGALRLVGAEDAAEDARRITDYRVSQHVNAPTLAGAIEGYLPKAKTAGQEAIGLAAEFVGGAAVPMGGLAKAAGIATAPKIPVVRKAPTRGGVITDISQRLKIRPTPATTGGPVVQTTQMGLGNLPGASGPVSRAVQQETDDLAAAARGVASRMGAVSTRQRAGEVVARGAKAFSKASGAKGGKLYQARTELMGGETAPILMGSASREIRSFADDFPNTPLLASIREHPAVRKLGQALPDGPEAEVTLREATEALSHIRGALRNAERTATVTPAIKARIARVEQALEDDVMRAAQASDVIAGRSGEGSATAAQIAADKFWAQRSSTLGGPLKTAMASSKDPASVGGERVYSQLVADMGREGGNLARLKKTWEALPTNARRTFSATAFDDLGRATSGAQDDVGGQWSFNTFLTKYDKMAPEARNLVFGAQAQKDIKDIATYAARLRELDRSRNFSNTARAGLAGAYLTVVGGQIWSGDWEGAVKTAFALPAAAMTGKLFVSTPAMRSWTKQALVALRGAGTPASEKALRRLTDRLPAIAAANPSIRAEVAELEGALLRALNDNYAPKAVSGEQTEKQQEK